MNHNWCKVNKNDEISAALSEPFFYLEFHDFKFQHSAYFDSHPAYV